MRTGRTKKISFERELKKQGAEREGNWNGKESNWGRGGGKPKKKSGKVSRIFPREEKEVEKEGRKKNVVKESRICV